MFQGTTLITEMKFHLILMLVLCLEEELCLLASNLVVAASSATGMLLLSLTPLSLFHIALVRQVMHCIALHNLNFRTNRILSTPRNVLMSANAKSSSFNSQLSPQCASTRPSRRRATDDDGEPQSESGSKSESDSDSDSETHNTQSGTVE